MKPKIQFVVVRYLPCLLCRGINSSKNNDHHNFKNIFQGNQPTNQYDEVLGTYDAFPRI